MHKSMTFETFAGYAVPYEQLAQFCEQRGKGIAPREQLQGPTCIIAEFELQSGEKEELARHPQASLLERCVCIDFNGESDKDRLDALGLLWCANSEEGFAFVALPESIIFLCQRSID